MAPKTETDRGVAAVHEIDSERAGQRLDNYLLATLKGVPRSHVYRLVRSGQVRVNSGRVRPSYRIKAGDRVRIPPITRARERTPRAGSGGFRWLEDRIVYEDSRLIVLDKPAGLAVHGGSGVDLGCIEMLRNLRPRERSLELAHRLDRATSGCLLIAKRRSALHEMHRLLREGRVDKRYLALVAGAWPRKLERVSANLAASRVGGEARVRVAAEGKPATTRFETLQRFGQLATLVSITLETGRTHQIRVHAASSGHAVAGDMRYGADRINRRFATLGLGRMYLHATTVSFVWPATGEPFGVSVPLPGDLVDFLALLERIEPEARERARQPDHR